MPEKGQQWEGLHNRKRNHFPKSLAEKRPRRGKLLNSMNFSTEGSS